MMPDTNWNPAFVAGVNTAAEQIRALQAENERWKQAHDVCCAGADKLVERVEALTAENQRLRAALDRDKTGLAEALAAVVKSAQGRTWILDGRGLYEWDDDAYREEAGYALHDIIAIATKALVDSGTLANEALR